jgi:hypothetical protein
MSGNDSDDGACAPVGQRCVARCSAASTCHEVRLVAAWSSLKVRLSRARAFPNKQAFRWGTVVSPTKRSALFLEAPFATGSGRRVGSVLPLTNACCCAPCRRRSAGPSGRGRTRVDGRSGGGRLGLTRKCVQGTLTDL